MTSVNDLLAPVSDASPAGEDLAYDGERQAIEQAFERAGQGDTDIDWRETVSLIEDQSRRTKDVWLAVYLARAGARLGRLETVETGCAMLAGLFERYWDSVHPTLEDYGLPGRRGPCESLTRIGEFLGPLRRTTLVEHPRLGSYAGADFERFASEGEGAEGYGLFRAALADTPVETLSAAIARLDSIRDCVLRADVVLTGHAAALGDTGTNFQTTYDALAAIRRAVSPYTGVAESAAAADGTADPAATATTLAEVAVATVPGRIDNREGVLRAIDAIADYYGRREPSSPVPVALIRVKGWVTMDFMAILKDIAPSSIADVGTVLLARVEDSGSSTW
ncbi:MAG: type VI secretion system protein TssA [Janthinobacterium lividum]